jgi:hypothetical protein
MRASIFPIARISKNGIISTKGHKSYFYKLDCLDLDQMNLKERKSFYDEVGFKLNSMASSSFYRFYRINSKSYLNTSMDGDIAFGCEPCNNPLEVFFEGEELYSNLGIYDDYLSYNGLYKRVISIKNFKQIEFSLENLPQGIDYVLQCKRLSKTKALKKLELIRSSHQSSFLKTKKDFEGEGAYTQAEELIEDLTCGDECLFEMEMFFLPKADSLEELSSQTKILISDLTQAGMTPFIEGHSLGKLKFGLGEIFKELIPGVCPEFKYRKLPNKTSHLKQLIPLHESSLMKRGVAFHDQTGNELFLNPFDKSFKNRNMLVTGSSGGGKSVLVNKLVHSLIIGHPTVILDKGGSFRKLCLYHDGEYLKSQINPLDLKCPYYLREFILSVVELSRFDKLSRGLLLKEIKRFLAEDKTSNFFNLLNQLENSFEQITLYFEDLKDFISTEKTSFRSFLYVDIERFPKSQVSPLIIYVLEYFKKIDKSEKVLVFDEAWSFLKGHEGYIDEQFREIRKTGALAIAIAQGYKDFSNLNSELYTSITNNSYFKFFFSQDFIKDSDFFEFDNMRLKELEYKKGHFSDCYLKTQDERFKKVIRIFLTPLEYELFHTETQRNDLFDKFYFKNREYFESNSKTIDAFVRLHHEMA